MQELIKNQLKTPIKASQPPPEKSGNSNISGEIDNLT